MVTDDNLSPGREVRGQRDRTPEPLARLASLERSWQFLALGRNRRTLKFMWPLLLLLPVAFAAGWLVISGGLGGQDRALRFLIPQAATLIVFSVAMFFLVRRSLSPLLPQEERQVQFLMRGEEFPSDPETLATLESAAAKIDRNHDISTAVRSGSPLQDPRHLATVYERAAHWRLRRYTAFWIFSGLFYVWFAVALVRRHEFPFPLVSAVISFLPWWYCRRTWTRRYDRVIRRTEQQFGREVDH
jgi:hypothetical protein